MESTRMQLFALTLTILIGHSQCASDQVCKDGNEEYMSCGTACPDTCETIMSPGANSQMCTMQCVPGCFCKNGFVRDTVTKRCVETYQCKHPRDSDVQQGSGAGTASAFWTVPATIVATLIGHRVMGAVN